MAKAPAVGFVHGLFSTTIPWDHTQQSPRWRASLLLLVLLALSAPGWGQTQPLTLSYFAPDGYAGQAYYATLNANGGTPGYTYSISAGSLPSGLTLTALSGLISGTPAAAGISSFTAKVQDSAGRTQSVNLTVKVFPVLTSISPFFIEAGTTQTLVVGGFGFVPGMQILWMDSSVASTSVSSTQLTAPIGADYTATAGIKTIDVIGPDGLRTVPGHNTIVSYVIVIPVITDLTPTSVLRHSAVTLNITGKGFTPDAIVFLSPTGAGQVRNLDTAYVSPTRLTAEVTSDVTATFGIYYVVVRIPDVGDSRAAPITFWTGVTCPATLTVSSGDQQSGSVSGLLPIPLMVKVTCQADLPAAGADGARVHFVIIKQPSGATGAGVVMQSPDPVYLGDADAGPDGSASAQLILGNKPGQYQVEAACNGYTCNPQSVIFTVTAVAPPVVLGCPTSTGTKDVPYTSAFAASGGTPPYTSFGIATGSLPPGLTFNAVGGITGTPTAAGAFPFTGSVTDSVGGSGTASCSITIAVPPCTSSLSYPSRNFPKEGGPGAVDVTASDISCPVYSSSQVDWVTFSGQQPQYGSGSVFYSVASNSGLPRHTTPPLLVANQPLLITQDGTCGGPNITRINVPDYKQFTDPWGPKPYNTLPGETIGSKGCLLSAYADVLSFYQHPYNPDTLNTTLDDLTPDGYSSAGDVALDTVGTLSGGTLQVAYSGGSTDELDQELCAGRPVIVHVPGHFVVVTGKQDGTYLINDPGTPQGSGTLSDYGNTFDGQRKFVPPGTGSIVIYSTPGIEVGIIDPSGKRAGYFSGNVITEIPGAFYGDNSGDQSVVGSKILVVPVPPDGVYILQVTSTSASRGTVQVYKYSKQRNLPQGSQVQQVTLSSGQTLTLPVVYSSLPGDVNGDGNVNCADVAIVRASLGKRVSQAGFDARADVNLDGIVDIRDLALVSQKLPAGTRCQ